MNAKQKEKFQVRMNIARASFYANGIHSTREMLKQWTLKELYELLEPEYQFMDDQKSVIVDAIEFVSEQKYEEMWLFIGRFKTLIKCQNAEQDIVFCLKMIGKLKKEFPHEEFKAIANQDSSWKDFFKELPKLKKLYGVT